jgi:type I restriction enzyme M protein
VIGLPPNLFYSTVIPACLLIFRADKPAARRGSVLFIDSSARFTKGRNQNQLGDDDVSAIVAAYRHGEAERVHVRLVDHAEIKDNGWNLNLGRYLKATMAERISVEAALADFTRAQAALHDAEAKLSERLKAAEYA